MLFEKKMNRASAKSKFGMRVFLILPLLSLLASCTTTYIPGLDRILFADSSAKVGPLVAADEQNPSDDGGAASTVSNNDLMVDPRSESPVLIGKNKPDLETEPEPEIQTTEQSTSSPPRDNDAQALINKAKPANADVFKSSKNVAPEISVEKENIEVVTNYGAVAGKVILIGDKGQPLPMAGTLITLAPKKAMNEVQNRSSKVHIIDMKDKEYQPRYSAINAGDQLVFVNKDNIQHNVFSSSGSNAFDLGTYGAGLKRAVTLEEPGVVKIYCNIHAEMATFIAVGNQGLSAKADDQGSYLVDKVLPGTYEVTIWNIRGETKQLIEVKANQTVKLVDQIDTLAFRVESHKNKFGGEYSKNSALFEDEFY